MYLPPTSSLNVCMRNSSGGESSRRVLCVRKVDHIVRKILQCAPGDDSATTQRTSSACSMGQHVVWHTLSSHAEVVVVASWRLVEEQERRPKNNNTRPTSRIGHLGKGNPRGMMNNEIALPWYRTSTTWHHLLVSRMVAELHQKRGQCLC